MKSILFIAIILLIGSCMPLANLETGRTLGEDKQSFQVQVDGYFIDNTYEDVDGVVPNVSLKYAHAMNSKLDLGVSITSGGNAQLITKYQFAGNQTSKYALALGFKLGIQALYTDQVHPIRLYFPLYFSYHPTPKYALFLNPMLAKQLVQGDHNSNFYGLTAGTNLYLKNNELAIGASYQSVQTGREISQFFMLGLGLTHPF